METQYLYLMLNIGTISIPLLASFYPKANFSARWRSLFPAILITGTIFIIWDILFTHWGVWGFTDKYLIGVKLFYLPIEEWLFFITIPYACTFTYFALAHLIPSNPLKSISKSISYALIAVMSIGVWLYHNRIYTIVTAILLIALLIYLNHKKEHEFLGRFYLAYLFILIPFVIVNGILTGTGLDSQVVWYNNTENTGFRLLTIPIEDFFYCQLLLISNMYIYEKFRRY